MLEITYWLDTFQEGIDAIEIRNRLMVNVHRELGEGGFTYSSNVTTSISLGGHQPVDININNPASRAESA